MFGILEKELHTGGGCLGGLKGRFDCKIVMFALSTFVFGSVTKLELVQKECGKSK